jgi:hypothetical protein
VNAGAQRKSNEITFGTMTEAINRLGWHYHMIPQIIDYWFMEKQLLNQSW